MDTVGSAVTGLMVYTMGRNDGCRVGSTTGLVIVGSTVETTGGRVGDGLLLLLFLEIVDAWLDRFTKKILRMINAAADVAIRQHIIKITTIPRTSHLLRFL